MPSISAHFVNEVLTKNRFFLRKGDARRVADAAKSQSNEDLIAAATELGIELRPQSQKKPKPQPAAPVASVSYFDIMETEDPLRLRALKWIAEYAARILSSPETLNGIVSKWVSKAVTSTRRVHWEDTPRGYRGCNPRALYDLSQWKTLGDFLLEPTDETRGFDNRHVSFGDVLHDEMFSLVLNTLRLGAEEATEDDLAPAEIAQWASSLSEDELDDLAIDDGYEALCQFHGTEEGWLLSAIESIPFGDAVREHRPDAAARLEKDMDAANQRARNAIRDLARLEDLATGIRAQFGDSRIGQDKVFEVANAIIAHVRRPGDIELAKRLFRHQKIQTILTKGARSALRDMGEEWSMGLEGMTPNFERPLVKLFVALDDAWRKDGRSWYITVSDDACTSTFGTDNWIFLLAYALTQGWAKARFGVVVRRFEHLFDTERNLPIKSVGGVFIDENGAHLLSAEEIRSASTTDHKTGQEIPVEPTVRYVPMADLCPGFAAAITGADGEGLRSA